MCVVLRRQAARAAHGRSALALRSERRGGGVHSAPGDRLAAQAGLKQVSLLRADDGGGMGYALYAVDLSR
jgi:2',3'-cyclic-nucleotide 2'-phosphodiesterase/3'-nucleotidase